MNGEFESFFSRCPEIAPFETRSFLNINNDTFPKGHYFIIENYCNDKKCDCRKVIINIVKGDEIFATIGYGWENITFYQEWVKDKELGLEMKGPSLEVAGEQTEYANNILKFFNEVILKYHVFLQRLKKHYKLFKDRINENSISTKKNEIMLEITDDKSKSKKLKENNRVIIKFECNKCGEDFDCEVGKITFPDKINEKLGFEKDIICPNCGKLEEDEIFLSEYGQTQISQLYFKDEPVIRGYGAYEGFFPDDKSLKKDLDDSIEKLNNMEKITPKKIGRNEPCPCGSGKKYKKYFKEVIEKWLKENPKFAEQYDYINSEYNKMFSQKEKK